MTKKKLDTSVKETVRRMMYSYPSLYRTKGDAFNHLFLTIGGGYDWHKGALVCKDHYDKYTGPRWKTEKLEEILEERTNPLDITLAKRQLFDHKRINNTLQFTIENFDEIFDDHVELRAPYPPNVMYSNLFTMPDDVKDDWRQACNETSFALRYWANMEYQRRTINDPARVHKMNNEFRKKHFEKQDNDFEKIMVEILKK